MEEEDEDTIIVAGPLRDKFLRASALRNEPLYADRGPDQVLDARVLQNGEYIYLVKRTGKQAHQWEWETAEEGRLSEAMIQTWLESDVHLAEIVGPPDLDEYRREHFRRIEVDKIIGEDENRFLVAWRPHPRTGAQLKPFWWERENIDPELHQEWFELIRRMQRELEAWLKNHDDQRGFWPEYDLPAHGRFFAILAKPVSKIVRECIEQSYPNVFERLGELSPNTKQAGGGESKSDTDTETDMGEDIACENESAGVDRSDQDTAEDSGTNTPDRSESDGEEDGDEDGDADDEKEEDDNDEHDSEGD